MASQILNRDSVIDLVQKGLKEKDRKSRNVIVRGLAKSSTVDDRYIFRQTCFSAL